MNLNLTRKKTGLLLLFACLLSCSLVTKAQTTLSAGDIVIIGWNATDNSTNTPGNAYTDDDVDFLLLKDISAGTTIYFTDLGWISTSFMHNEYGPSVPCSAGAGGVTDGCLRWTASAAMTAGTQVRVGVHFGRVASSGTVDSILKSNSGTGGPGNIYQSLMSLATSTDQIFAFQSSSSSDPLNGTITLLAAVQYSNIGGTTWGSGVGQCQSTGSNQSNDPNASVGSFAFLLSRPTSRNSSYTGATTSGSASAIRAAVLDSNNWSSSSTTPFTFPTATSYSVGKLWAGTTTNWATAGNWSPSGVPTSTDNVIIPAGASSYPNISTGTATVNNITINSGASVSVTGSGVLQIAGTITNNGTFTASSGGITMNGSTAQTLSGSDFNGSTIEDLVISNTAGVSISSALNIAATGSLTVSSGSTFTTGGNLTLLSTSSGTARVANSAGTISGNVTVQRYIPGGRRAYRFLSNPLTTTQPLSVLTDDIDITGTGGSLNGFTTTTTNHPSAFWYDQSVANGSTSADPGWTAFTSTNGAGSNGWQKGKGLLVLIRGAIGEGLNGAAYTPSAVTLDVTGTINQGSNVINITKGSGTTYYFTGNPFPSQIDMSLVTRGGGIGATYYTWDATLNSGKGGYVNRSWLSSYSLPSMAGFITTVSSSTTLTFSESCKTSNTPGAIFKTTNVTDGLVFYLASNNDSITYDRLEIMFDNNAVNDSDYWDGAKMVNPEVNFYTFSNDNAHLSIDARPYKNGEIIPMNISSAPEGHYAIKAEDFNMTAGNNIYLHDKYLNKVEQVTPGYVYNFDITSDPLTQGNRFALEMSSATSVKNVAASTLAISPNPVHDVATITSPVNGKANIRIMNMQGAVCRQLSKDVQAGGNIQVPMRDLPNGVYIVELTCEGQTAKQKLIKE